SGVTIRTSIADIREVGRATQGVRLIKIDEGDEIAAITKLNEPETDDQLIETVIGDPIQVSLDETDTTNIEEDSSNNNSDSSDEESNNNTEEE
ncbi:MAG TPA: DNA gyrase C-terminal beta-propeller domain-containing protein, partial [Chitinophagaceae bacterium]|nr:DNA gyrase C-terminal beta-propeller domain-containing protein [Chitinophagaceae bacterium]